MSQSKSITLLFAAVILVNLGTCKFLHAQGQDNKSQATDNSKTQAAENQADDSKGELSERLKWGLGILLTAIISPIIVKAAEKLIASDPIKEKTARLQQVIDLQAARQKQGLPPDGRLTALINELTDALGDEAKGKQQALDESTSFLLGTLSSRLLEALHQSCHQVGMLLDSKHSSDALSAIYDLTRLEFLRAYWGFRRMAVPQYFMSIKREDLDNYANEISAELETLGDDAISHANALGSTESDVRTFVEQIRNEISNAQKREIADPSS